MQPGPITWRLTCAAATHVRGPKRKEGRPKAALPLVYDAGRRSVNPETRESDRCADDPGQPDRFRHTWDRHRITSFR